jgi:transcriptional regulator GlxA family with amidase domain
MLGRRVRGPVAFAAEVPLRDGSAAAAFGQLRFLVEELKRPGGFADNPLARAAYAGMVPRLLLSALPHAHGELLRAVPSGAAPFYVRRAEDFMLAHAELPLRMEDVARAAGCGVRTLQSGFRRFRDTTPLAALHAIRLDRVRLRLLRDGGAESVAAVARRYGFTHPGRFGAAYRRRFHETPGETRRRGGVW